MSTSVQIADPSPASVSTPERLPLRMVKAARLLAEDKLTNLAIATQCGVSEYAISRWKRNFPAFVELVERYRAVIAHEAHEHGIALKHNRVRSLNRRWMKLNKLLDDRATDAAANPEFVGVPGADTGLLVRQRKCIGGGQHGEFINEFVIDHDLLKAINEVEEQAARELGQYEPDKRPVGDEHKHVHIHYPQMTDAESAAAMAAQEADMPPAARRLLTRPNDGKPLDR